MVARRDGAVALLVVHPQAGQEGGVAQPTAAAVRRRGQPAAAGVEARLRERLGARVQRPADTRCHHRVLDRAAAVALDEGEDHVLAAQVRHEFGAGRGAEAVRLRLPGEGRLVPQRVHDPVGLRLGGPGGVGGGDRHAERLHAQRRAGHPHGGRHQRGPGRPLPVRGEQLAEPDRRQRRQHHQQQGQRHRAHGRPGRRRPAHRVRHVRPGVVEQAPVQDQVEAAAQVLGEAHVEQVQHGQRAQGGAGQRRRRPPRPPGQAQQQHRRDDRLRRDPREAAGLQGGEGGGQQERPEDENGRKGRRDPAHDEGGPRVPGAPGAPVGEAAPEGLQPGRAGGARGVGGVVRGPRRPAKRRDDGHPKVLPYETRWAAGPGEGAGTRRPLVRPAGAVRSPVRPPARPPVRMVKSGGSQERDSRHL